MALIELIVEDIIKVPLVSQEKSDVLRELVQVLKDAGKIDDFEGALRAVQEREDKMSTGLQDGLAVPHGKAPVIPSLELAIGISPTGIDFDALDGNPTHLFFLLLAPPDQAGPHVQALAEIAKLAQSKAFCKALVHAESAEEVVELMKGE